MENADKRRLRKNRTALVESLEPSRIMDDLIELEVFTPDMAEEITAKTGTRDQVRDLLRKLELRGTSAYSNFRQVLQSRDYKYLVEKLDNTQLDNADESDARPNREVQSTFQHRGDPGGQGPRHVTNNVIGNNNFSIFCGQNTTINKYSHH